MRYKAFNTFKMKVKKITITLIFALFGINISAQTSAVLPGTWRGSSICQITNSPCHDEEVVYHISRLDSFNLFKVIMNKIVNNKEEDMGILNFTYDAQQKTLTSIDVQS